MNLKLGKDKLWVPIIVGLSILVPVLVLILLNLPTRYNLLGLELGTYPLFHAVLNGATAILLVIGFSLMRAGYIRLHRNVMITAFGLSCVFLISYVLSKLGHDPVHYGGNGLLKYLYYFILITHIVLSAIIVPLVLFTMYRGLTKEFDKHRKIAKWTFPIWMYVAVTGVLVYVFMVPYY